MHWQDMSKGVDGKLVIPRKGLEALSDTNLRLECENPIGLGEFKV